MAGECADVARDRADERLLPHEIGPDLVVAEVERQPGGDLVSVAGSISPENGNRLC